MKTKRLVAILLVLAVLVCGLLVACNEECSHEDADNNGVCDVCGESLGSGNNTNNGPKETYTISVKSMGGVGFSKVTLLIYNRNTDQLIDAITTEANGIGSKDLPIGDYYATITSGVPDGYKTQDKYYFSSNRTINIVLQSEVVSGSHTGYKLGSVMKDFTISTTTGGTFKLSEALKTKDAVLLNFFYTTCNPCIQEFPYLDEAAGMYDNIAVVSVDTYGDTFQEVQMFRSTEGIENIEMGIHSIDLFAAFNASGYPTSVMIDKYGVICLIEVGSLPYLYPWTQLFDYFSQDNYTQRLFTSIDELTPQEKPTIKQPASADVATVMSGNGISDDTVYYPETEDPQSDYYWPFVLGEKEGEACMVSSNKGKYNSLCAMHVDVTLQANQALSLDYIVSTERTGDIFYILVDGELIYSLAGYDEVPTWKKVYPFVALHDDTYKISFIYNKDLDIDEGEDTVYIKNLAVTNASAIDVETYIPRNAVSVPDEYFMGYENYVNVVKNEEDGYYHVNTVDGPLLLANMMNYVIDDDSDERTSIYLYALENGFIVDGVDYYEALVRYASYASNGEIGGYCTVNEELKGLLEKMNTVYPGGVNDRSENGWLRFCRYYDAYAAEQLEDPIAGLAPFSAPDIVVNDEVGLDEYPNSVEYKMIIMPRGKIFSFTPDKSGVYRILSNSNQEVDGWIFDEASFYAKYALYTADHYERLSDTNNDGTYTQMEYGLQNVCMTYYFEKGKEYFIDIAYYDVNAVGTINFKVEYLGEEYTMFRYASPAPFTFYVDPETGNPPVDGQGNEVYTTIAGGVEVELRNDGYYYVKGTNSKLYVDFTMPVVTGFMVDPILSYTYHDENADKDVYVKGILERGGFDFSKDADGNAVAGGVDYSDRIQWYADNKMILSDGFAGSEASLSAGCVAVDEELAQILQKLVDKYSFKGIENSWTKLCYYFDYLGA